MSLSVPAAEPSVADVVIAVLTFHREELLAHVLPLLADQATSVRPTARIVVVDNDPGGGARDIVEAFRASRADVEVDYAHEPRPGIAAARNCALDAAREVAALVFIDDDEQPGSHWLYELVTSWRAWGCAAVTGPVRPSFEVEPDAWLSGSEVFARRVLPNATAVAGAATNNLLLDMAKVNSLKLRFDERFGLTGGEDTMFSHQLTGHGEKILWCDDAEVVDQIPAGRINRTWVLRRSYRAGTSWSRMELTLSPGRFGRLKTSLSLAIRAITGIGLGSLSLGRGLIARDVARRARATCTVTSYLGMLSGTFGLSLGEYRRGKSVVP